MNNPASAIGNKTKCIFRQFLFLLFIPIFSMGYGQSVLYVNDDIKVTGDAEIYIKGNLETGINAYFDNGGIIYLTDSLFNNRPELFRPSSYGSMDNEVDGNNDYILILNIGKMVFEGSRPKLIHADESVLFDSIIFNTIDTTKLEGNDAHVLGGMIFNKGMFNINENQLKTYYKLDDYQARMSGFLFNESDSGRIIDPEGTGYVEMLKNLPNDNQDKWKKYRSLGIVPYNAGGETKIQRYHYFDKTLTDTSIGWVFKLISTDNTGSNSPISIFYIDSSGLHEGIVDTTLGIWFKGPIADIPVEDVEGVVTNADYRYNNDYNKYTTMYYPSYSKCVSDTILDSVAGTGILQEGYYYTAAEINCDVPVNINMPDNKTVCVNDLVKLCPFNDTTNWREYFYMWNSNIETLIDDNKRSALETSFVADTSLINKTVKIWVDVRNVRGCHASDTVTIVVKDTSGIGIKIFDMDSASIAFNLCGGIPFQLLDTINSDMSEKSHSWSFDKMQPIDDSTAFIAHVLTTPGQHVFDVEYVNEFGCISRKYNNTIDIHPYPVTGMDVQTPVCAGSIAQIINNSSITPVTSDGNVNSSITSYTWKFNRLDSIIVTDVITDFCSMDFKTLPLKAGSVTHPDLYINFADSGWTEVILKARSNNGCTSFDTAMAYVNSPPVAAIDTSSLTTNVCKGLPSIFIPGDSCENIADTGYHWKFTAHTPWVDDDSTGFTFASAGTFPVILAAVSDSGCRDTAMAEVTIHPNTVANFVFDNNCLGLTSVFEDSLASGANVYTWDYGDGTIETDAPVNSSSHRYDSSGTYEVTMITNNQWNCSDTIRKTIDIYPIPKVRFETDPIICINDQDSIFRNFPEPGVSYHWDFGDGTEKYATQTNKQYSLEDEYIVTLTGISEFGCSADTARTIEIFGLVNASFDPAQLSVCRGLPSTFEPTNPNLGNLSEIYWNFGDGYGDTTDATHPGTQYIYPTDGSYLATMITVSDHYCTDTAQLQVVIHPNPQITIQTHGQRCSEEDIVFTPDASLNLDDISEFTWNFGDGSMPKNIPNVTHSYNNAGLYQVTVNIISQQGCMSYDTLDLTIDSLPPILFSDPTGTCETSLELRAGPDTYDYLWNDGSTGNTLLITKDGYYEVTITNPVSGCINTGGTHVSLSAQVLPGLGNDLESCDAALLNAHNPGARYYAWSTGDSSQTVLVNTSGTFWVKVMDINECIGYDTIEVTINDSPELTLPDVLSACGGDSVTIDPGISTGHFIWNTGDTTSTVTTNKAGTYFVRITDDHGCSDNALTNLTFYPIPIVYLGQNISVCDGNSILLNAGNTGAGYLWSTGETTQTINPDSTGKYSVSVTNAYACTGYDTIQVTINALQEVDLGGDQSLCHGQSVLLDASVEGTYYWSTMETSRTISVNQEAIYWVRVTDSNNCSVLSAPIELTLRESPEYPFVSDSVAECAMAMIDAENPGADYLWNDGYTGRTYRMDATGLLWVEITNYASCSITDSLHVTIKPQAVLALPDEVEICSDGYDFVDAGWFGEDYSYSWNIGSTEQYIRVDAPGVYKVNVTHIDGCSSTDSTLVTSIPAPDLDLGNEILLCANSGLSLNAGNTGSLYSWGSSNGLSFSGQILPLADTGRYWVFVMAPNGCTARDTVDVLFTSMSIEPLFLAASQIAIGDTVKFVDLSVPQPTSYYWDFGDMITSTDTNPTHIYYTEDTFTTQLTVSNGVCSASIAKDLTVAGYNPDYLRKMAQEMKDINTNLILITDSKIYPNPASDYVNVSVKISQPSDIAMYLYGLNGQIFAMKKFDDIEQLEYTLNTSYLYQGMYFLQISTINEVKTFKVLIVR